MGPAAGAAVRPRPRHDPHRACQRLLAAVVQRLQLRLVRPRNGNGAVLPDVLIGQTLDLLHILRRQLRVEVDGHQLMADMESHIVALEASAQDAADNMFAAVLLHKVKAPVEIDPAADLTAHLQRLAAGVTDHAVPLPHVGYSRAAQGAVVRRLSAALRIKGRPVQDHLPPVFPLFAANHHGGKLLQKGVFIK